MSVMPKILDKKLNDKILKYVDEKRYESSSIDKLNHRLLSVQKITQEPMSPDQHRSRQASPFRSNVYKSTDKLGSLSKSRMKETAPVEMKDQRILELEREVRLKEKMVRLS
jgi:hypothetical protein